MERDEPAVSAEALLAHSEWVRELVRGLVFDPSRADDVIQETWVAALEHPPAEDRDLRSWLAVVARNAARRLGRGETRRRRREELVARVEALPDTVDVIEKARLQRRVVDAVLSLEEPYRRTLLLRYFEGLKPRQIAARLARPVNTVQTHLERGREKLRGALDREYGDRRAWGVALLPLLRGRGSGAILGSILKTGGLLQAGGWIVMLKWMVPAAVALVALVALFRGDLGGLEFEGPPAAVPAEGAPGIVDGPVKGGAPAEVSERAEVAVAPEAEPDSDAAEARALFQHRGRVVDPEGRPLGDFTLVLGQPVRAPAESLLGFLGLDRPRVTTDSTGRYSIALPVEEPELAPAEPGFVVLTEGEHRLDSGEQEHLVVVCAVAPVAGRVVDGEGRPVSGAELSSGVGSEGIRGFPYLLTDNVSYRSWDLYGTEADGGFRFEGLPLLESLELRVDADGFAPAVVELTAENRRELEIVLQRRDPRFVVSGTVLDEAGRVVESAEVVFGQDRATTDVQGRFQIDVTYLQESISLLALKPGAAPALLEGLAERLRADRRAGIDLVLRLGPPTSSIRGRVVDASGEPLAGVGVFLVGGTPNGTMITYVEHVLDGHFRLGETTDAEGCFELGGLFAESYGVRACDPSTLLAAEIQVVSPGTEGLELILDPDRRLPRVSGHVVDRRGAPVAGAELAACFEIFESSASGGSYRRFKTLELGRSGADGAFELRDVPWEGVGLQVGGVGIAGVRLELDPASAVGLVVEVPLLLRFRLARELAERADSFEVVDAAGERLGVEAFSPEGSTYDSRVRLSSGETPPTCEVRDDAAELILYREEQELRRMPLHLRRGEVSELR